MVYRKVFKFLKARAKFFCYTVVLGPSAFVLVESQIATLGWVEGVSMQPTFNPGSRSGAIMNVLLLKRIHNLSTIKRGDIVTFITPESFEDIAIKRVIGLEGDLIRHRTRPEIIRVRPGHCWLEGDNGDRSLDSNKYGQVPMGLIQCKAVWILKPWSMFGRVDGQSDLSRLHRSLIKRHKIAAGCSHSKTTENSHEMEDTHSTSEQSDYLASGSITEAVEKNLELEICKLNKEESVLV